MKGLAGPYARVGVALVVGGAAFTFLAGVLARSEPLVGLGIAAVFVGVVTILLGYSVPALSPEASALLLQTGLENLSMLVEEIGLEAPGIYLPSRLTGGRPRALIPLRAVARPFRVPTLLQRLIVSYGPEPHDVGLLVTTAGAAAMRFLGSSAGGSSENLEAALAGVLVGALDLGTAVRVRREDGRVVVVVASPRLDERDLWVARSLGSPLASIVATVVAEGLDRPVTVAAEDHRDGEVAITVEQVDEDL